LFTAKNIEDQLNRIDARFRQNDPSQKTKDESLTALRTSIRNNYGEDVGNLADDAVDITALSKLLSVHIQTSHCMLDSTIAAGVFAQHLGRPIVTVTNSHNKTTGSNQLDYRAVADDGTPVDFSEVEAQDAAFVHYNNHNHFERMTRLPGPVLPPKPVNGSMDHRLPESLRLSVDATPTVPANSNLTSVTTTPPPLPSPQLLNPSTSAAMPPTFFTPLGTVLPKLDELTQSQKAGPPPMKFEENLPLWRKRDKE
jgi:hypothetical protein